VAPALMGLAWRSVAALAIAPIQDLLNLGNEARMNVPGRADRNGAGAAPTKCSPSESRHGCGT
jgi:4-alpha-glucanotransferase